MGVAGPIFEPCPLHFAKLYNFCRCTITQARFSQIQEHPQNFNSTCKKTLLRLIFNKKFQVLEWWRPLEALEKRFFGNLKPVKISKNDTNIICLSLKNTLYFKITRLWLKNWACHAHFSFEI